MLLGRGAAAIVTAAVVLAALLVVAGIVPVDGAGVWTAVEAPLPARANATGYVVLGSVTCPAAGSCVAVGAYFDATDTQQGFIEPLSGGTCSASPAPLPSNASDGGSVLYDVSCPRPKACVAVGTYQPAS